MSTRRPPKNNKKKLLLAALVLLLLGGVIWLLLARDNVKFLNQTPGTKDDNAETTSDAPTAQSDFSEGDDRVIPDSTRDEGTITDNQGQINETPNQSSWSLSKTGEIIVYSPYKNSLLRSGDKLTGTSSLSSVSFRLIDDTSGVIAQGQLSVVNGKFSGTFNFSSSAQEGRLDVFATRSDGVEYGNIEVPVRFK